MEKSQYGKKHEKCRLSPPPAPKYPHKPPSKRGKAWAEWSILAQTPVWFVCNFRVFFVLGACLT